jgi:hypothetical protein
MVLIYCIVLRYKLWGDQLCAVVGLGDELQRVRRLCRRPSQYGNTAFGTVPLFLIPQPCHLHQDMGRVATPQ